MVHTVSVPVRKFARVGRPDRCLVGLDDGLFPRLGVVDGDDALSLCPMTGERDIRSEDRQLLLDAIGAATQELVIPYTGANE
ncbi:exodeoxyribonuclease V subunit gamma [Mycobacterium avium]|uniref:exodeoxyribonuclease V subunit gamma n=1 Tax=Mycobacterium avium TaxID=1764 RepID=UPI000A55021A